MGGHGSVERQRQASAPTGDASAPATQAEVHALRRLHDLDVTLSGSRSLADALDELAHVAGDVTGFGRTQIDLLRPDRRLETVATATSLGRPHLFVPHGDVAELLGRGEPWGRLRFVPGQRSGSARTPEPAASTAAVPPQDRGAWHEGDVLYAPLVSRQSGLLGVLAAAGAADGRRPEAWRCRVLEHFAETAAGVVEAGHARDLLLEEVRLSSVCRRILRAATQQLDLPGVIASSSAPLAEGLRADALWLRSFDPGDGRPEPGLGACHPPTLASMETDERFAFTVAVAARLWQAQAVSVVSTTGGDTSGVLTASEESEIHALLAALGYLSMMIVPLGVRDEVVGYIVAMRDRGSTDWVEQDRLTALEIAREIGPAIRHARLYGQEKEAVGELQELDRHKGELMATVAHELKNPLTSILGHLEVLSDQGGDSPSLTAITRNAERIRGLAEDLMMLARMEERSRPFAPVSVDLSQVVDATAQMTRIQADQAGVALRILGADRARWVLGEADDLGRVVDNLVSNAIKYTPAGGHVRVELGGEGDRVVLLCADDGLGIAPVDQRSIFGTFQRSSNPDARARPGHGLGLAIVQRIVARHHGSIGVRSTLGVGSEFRVELPAAADPA